MLSKVKTIILNGLEGKLIEVQTDIMSGLPSFEIVGLPDASVKEAKERIKIAIKNSGIEFPSKKIVINLAPADVRKGGTSFDIPMSIGILFAMQIIDNNKLEQLAQTIFLGELALDGKVQRINGVLPMCIEAKQLGIKRVILPKANAMEAAIVKDLEIIPVIKLSEIIDYINGKIEITPVKNNVEKMLREEEKSGIDFSDVKGQEEVKRALEIAAAGAHNCLLIGSPGAGKTMLSRRIPTILPQLTFEEALEITKIHSIMGILNGTNSLICKRPFRAPHHTATPSSILGGGKYPKPGEISLAHYGVLYLDEFPEFNRNIMEALREPLEDRIITINRANSTVIYPASFMLIASCNPCPCGFYGDEVKQCTCTEKARKRYISKISGPLLDRMDLQVNVRNISYEKISSKSKSESSEKIRERVNKARKIQIERYKNLKIFSNAELNSEQIEKYCYIDEKCKKILQEAFENLGLSARGYNKILKVARTIADIDGEENINYKHIAEAIQYRNLDRKFE